MNLVPFVLVVIAIVIAYQLQQLVALQKLQVRKVDGVADHLTMLFYALEQLYEMSGMHERFLENLPNEGRLSAIGGIRYEPRTDVDDPRSTAAWDTLLARMESRMEATVRMRERVQANDSGPVDDADDAMLRTNSREWTERVPMPADWPPYAAPCWFGVDEKRPERERD